MRATCGHPAAAPETIGTMTAAAFVAGGPRLLVPVPLVRRSRTAERHRVRRLRRLTGGPVAAYRLAVSLVAPPLLVWLTVALRLPSLRAPFMLSRDDGVYGASIEAVKAGGVPYRDVFSSQGPLFLPMARAAARLGGFIGPGPQADRMISLIAAVVTVLAVFALLRARGPLGAALVAVVVAASPAFVTGTGELLSEGPTIALSVAALAVLLTGRRDRAPWWRVLSAGLLVGAAVATKVSFAVPVAAVVGVELLGMRGRSWRAPLGALAAAAVVVLSTLPYGWHRVVAQSVRFHLDAAQTAAGETPTDALGLLHELGTKERPLLALLVAGVAAGVLRLLSGRLGRTDRAELRLPVLALLWSTTSVLLLLQTKPLFDHHALVLVVPLAVLGGSLRPAPVAGAAGVLTMLAIARPVQPPAPVQPQGWAAGVAAVRAHVPAGTVLLSDETGVAWFAGRPTPPLLQDASRVRLTDDPTALPEVRAALRAPRTCAVLRWSGLFRTKHLQLPPTYVSVWQGPSGKQLLVRSDCLGLPAVTPDR